MTNTIEIEPEPLSASRLIGLACISIALILAISTVTSKRISLKTPNVGLRLAQIEPQVEASSIQDYIKEVEPEKPPEPVVEVKPVEVAQTPPPVEKPVTTPPVKPKVASKPAPAITGTKAEWMAQAGIAESDWVYVEKIIGAENHLWCPTRWNGQKNCPSVVTETNPNHRASSAYGICQALPAHKMQSAGADWQTNVVTQLKWCHSYAQARYGGWQNAWVEWQRKHWW